MKNLKITLIGFTCIISLIFISCNTKKEQEKKSTTIEQKSDDQVLKSYLSKKESIRESFLRYFYGNHKEINSLVETDFLQVLDSLRMISADNFESLQNNTDKNFLFRETKDIKYFYDKFLVEYPYYHERFTGKKALINKGLESNLSDFNNPELLNIKSYVEYIKGFLYFHLKTELKDESYKKLDNKQLNATMNLIDKYFSNQKVIDFFKYYYLYDHIDKLGIKNIDSLYNEFIITCKDTSYIHKIKAYYSSESKGRKGHLIKSYKTVDGYNLDMHLFLPESNEQQKKRPVFVYFHGGSWSEGKPDYFFPKGERYAKKGWVAAAVEYRLAYRHSSLPFESLMDAKSAIRWLRQHADEFNIDTNRIVAYGNSAGGHLVLGTAMVKNWNENTDDLKISCVPNALLIVSGVYDLTDSTSWIRQDLRDRNLDENLVDEISPNYLVETGLPPTLVIHGTNDRNVPFSSAKEFVYKMKFKGNDIEFNPLEGARHFIWYGRYGKQVSEIVEKYLGKKGY